MICPVCHSEKLKVIDSRPINDESIKRRRECTACGVRFNTLEIKEESVKGKTTNDKSFRSVAGLEPKKRRMI